MECKLCFVCGRAVECKRFFFGFGHVVRRFRVSGLIVRLFTRRGPVWRCADRVQIGVARSKRSETHWFSRPRLIDRLSLPVDWPSHILDDPKRDQRITRGLRLKLGRPLPSSLVPRRSVLCGSPMPLRRRDEAFSLSCARAKTPRGHLCAKPIERRSSRHSPAIGADRADPFSMSRLSGSCRLTSFVVA